MTELGNRLREAREAKGLSLADVQEITKIQKRYLTGIEEGNYDMMPGKFYIRAFIKQYAEAVGLDHEQLFEEYKSEIPSSHEDEIPQRATKVETVRNTVPAEPSKLLEYLPKILVTAFVIGAIFLVWVLIPKSGSNDKAVKEETVIEQPKEQAGEGTEVKKETKQQVKAPEEVKKEEPVKQTLTAAGASGRKATYQLGDAEKFEVSILSKGETWIGVTDGSGKSYFGNILTKGQTQTFDLTGQTEAKIVVGFAPDTEIKINGETLAYQLPADKQVRQDIMIQVQPAGQ
ncbi:helix-turn-helix domain-containing protein [Bacillus sp. B190/17]|uniref:Helix-turn-helix domain-containing protein n=1 Tax=Bacillus lumedeiriae TaxID=3058829 RepID=A0ABW8I6D8_9BACI